MDRVQRLSRVLRRISSVLFWISVICLVFSPGAVFLKDVALDHANWWLRHGLDVDGIRFSQGHVGWLLRSLVAWSMASAFTVAVLSLGALIRLLHQFESKEPFSAESIRMLRFLGWVQVASAPLYAITVWVVARIAKVLTGQVISPWPEMFRGTLAVLFEGGLVLLIAFVMEEALRLKSEQDLVI